MYHTQATYQKHIHITLVFFLCFTLFTSLLSSRLIAHSSLDSSLCGYVPTENTTEDPHICNIVQFIGYQADSPLDCYMFTAQVSYDEICAELPSFLPVQLACAETPVELPVSWTCADYTGEAGSYHFYATWDCANCVYVVADDASTTDLDEAMLPYIEVTIQSDYAAEENLNEETSQPESVILTQPETALAEEIPVTDTPQETEPLLYTLHDEIHHLTVSSSVSLPENAYLSVTEVQKETAQQLLGNQDSVILFAYDIKILIPNETGDVEYQPAADCPLLVTIASSSLPVQSSVQVTHIGKDAETEETTVQLVDNVTTTDTAVEFAAESFSIYIGTTAKTEVTEYPATIYYNSGYFYSDEACTGDATKIVDDTGTPFTRIAPLLIALTGDTTIYLKSTYSVTATESIANANYTVTLKRWAHSTDYDSGDTNTFWNGNLLSVSSDGNLTLADIIIDGGAVWSTANLSTRTNNGIAAESPIIDSVGRITLQSGASLQNNDNTGYAAGGVSINGINAAFTMDGGSISGNATQGFYGGGVDMSGGSFTMSNGSISGNTVNGAGGGASLSSTNTIMTGGAISGNAAQGGGGGVYMSNGSFNMSAGSISDNTAREGGGISVVDPDAIFTLSGGEISGNAAVQDTDDFMAMGGNGGGMSMSGGSAFIMNSGTISGNTANGDSDNTSGMGSSNGFGGGGVYVSGSDTTFTMNGGTLTNNEAMSNSGGDGGGGAYVNSGTFIAAGGTLSGNTANTGSGIYVRIGDYYGDPGILNLLGSPTITDTVYLENSRIINVTGAFTPTQAVSVTSEVTTEGTVIAEYGETAATAADCAYFRMTDTALSLSVNGVDNTQLVLAASIPTQLYWNGTYFFTDAACTAGNEVKNNSGTAYTTLPTLLADVGTGEALTIYMNAAYTVANEQEISCASRPVKLMRSGDINGDNTMDDPYTGSLITVSNTGDLTLADITIDGGAVWGGTTNTTLQRGTANSGLQATESLIKSTGSLTMNDGAYIQNNVWLGSDGAHNGGGINSVGTLTISGGAVRNCYAGHYGGGIEATGIFNMTGGEVYGNECSTSGGGIMLRGGATTLFTLSGGSIHNNVGNNCGGVCVAFGTTFIMDGGTISYNYAGNGGGIYLHGNSSATINAGSITHNSAQTGGGCGIESDGGTLIMNGGEITYNTATTHAGGVLSKNTEVATNKIIVQVNGGSILNNTVKGVSEDIYNTYAYSSVNVTIDGGTVGTVTLDPSDSTVLPKNSSGNSVVQQTITVPNISAITTVSAIDITDGNGAPYSYGEGTVTQTNESGTLSLWLPADCTVNSVTTLSNGVYTTHELNETSVHAKISYTSLEVPAVLNATLINGGTTAISYQWQRDGVAIIGETESTYETIVSDINKAITVVIIGSDDETYSSAPVTIHAPQLSVTIPTATIVTVDPSGNGTSPSGNIVNHSAVDIYITEVLFTWNTAGDADANEYFHDYTKVSAGLKLGGSSTAIQTVSGAVPETILLNESQGKLVKNEGTLSILWEFNLNKASGNYIKKATNAGVETQVATITYTIDYLAPS